MNFTFDNDVPSEVWERLAGQSLVDITGDQAFEEVLGSVAHYCLTELHITGDIDLNIIFVQPEDIAQLHEEWLGLPGPTDVMSFPLDEIRPPFQGSGILGDIVICPEFAAQQAADAGRTFTFEIILLTVHGILHLCGYDHATPAEQQEMFTLQDAVIVAFFQAHPAFAYAIAAGIPTSSDYVA